MMYIGHCQMYDVRTGALVCVYMMCRRLVSWQSPKSTSKDHCHSLRALNRLSIRCLLFIIIIIAI